MSKKLQKIKAKWNSLVRAVVAGAIIWTMCGAISWYPGRWSGGGRDRGTGTGQGRRSALRHFNI